MPVLLGWLKDIALAVDELLQTGQWVRQRFQRMVVQCEETNKRQSKGLSRGGRRLVEYLQNEGRSGGTGSGVLPVRPLTLPEKYAWLAAIHDVVCERTRPVDPYRTDKHSKRGKAIRSQSGWARRLAGMPYGVRKTQVRELTDEDRPRLERALVDVARHLGKPNLLRRESPRTTVVVQEGPQTINVVQRRTTNVLNQRTLKVVNIQSAVTGNGKAKSPQKPEKPRKRAKRQRQRRATPTHEMIKAHALHTSGLPLRAIRDALKTEYGKKAPKSPTTVGKWIEIADAYVNPKARSARARHRLREDRRGQADVADN